MKKHILPSVAAILTLIAVNPTDGSEPDKTHAFLKRQAEVYLKAYMDKDYDTCLNMMGSELARALGGKIAVLDNFRQTEESLKRHDLKLETMSVEEPGPVIRQGTQEQYVVIPEKHFFVSKNQERYVLNSYLLAVSENSGQSWNMLEGSWRISEHIKNHNLPLFDRLKLPNRKIYLEEDSNLFMLEKGGSFMTPPEVTKYKRTVRQRGNPPPPKPATY